MGVPWKPGQSGNPKGRPKGKAVSELFREVLEVKRKDGSTSSKRIIRKFIEMAENGSVPHADFLFNRAYGKPTDPSKTTKTEEVSFNMMEFLKDNPEVKAKYIATLKRQTSGQSEP